MHPSLSLALDELTTTLCVEYPLITTQVISNKLTKVLSKQPTLLLRGGGTVPDQ